MFSKVSLKINADSIRFISNVAPGRILRAEVDAFETLSKNGRMRVIVANTGRISSQYSVSVAECSPNILPIVARSVTLAAAQTVELVFEIVSSAELGSVANFCIVQMRNVEAVVLDRVRVDFNTSDVVKSAGAQAGNAPNNSGVSSPPPSGPDLVCGQCSFFDFGCSIANSCTLNLLKSISSVVVPLGIGLLLLKVKRELVCELEACLIDDGLLPGFMHAFRSGFFGAMFLHAAENSLFGRARA
jgi:hypothetical protein